jgi:hypothetical protein
MIKEKIFTGLYDMNGLPIHLGETLISRWGYSVTVYQDKENGDYYGKLVCRKYERNSCRNIPYSLNNGEDYIIAGSLKETDFKF